MTNSFGEKLFCPAKFEHICWPQIPINQSVNVSCAALRHPGVISTKFIRRACLPSGLWSNMSFGPCFYPDILAVMNKSYELRPPGEKEIFQKIVRVLRIVELAGLSISLMSILISLLIFFFFKSLYCNRTKIHINLLLAILIQIITRLTTYGLQMVQLKDSPRNFCNINGSLDSNPTTSVFDGVCPLVIILLQFGITAMFMWMLCEGIHLNNVLTVSVFKNHFKTFYFHILGWVVPFCLTLSWSIVMLIKERGRKCFNNYMHLRYYWIIDGPRYAVMIINTIFLLNIIRVLMVKIREGSEKQIRDDKKFLCFTSRKRRTSINARFVRKAVKAAVFLLPLLGITHVLETFISADDKPITIFAIYGSVSVLLMTLQGFFCSLFYCFLNAEVRETLSRRFQSTQFGYRWKQYLGKKKDQEDPKITYGDVPFSKSVTPKKSVMEMEECQLTSDIDGGNLANKT